MEVGEWWMTTVVTTCGLFSMHPANTDVYVWQYFGSPTKLKIQSNKVVLRTVCYSILRFIQVVITKYTTRIKSNGPGNSSHRAICG